jgi:hypothetical protein
MAHYQASTESSLTTSEMIGNGAGCTTVYGDMNGGLARNKRLPQCVILLPVTDSFAINDDRTERIDRRLSDIVVLAEKMIPLTKKF